MKKLTPGKSKGINIVTWNGLIKQPKLAKGKSMAYSGFISPRVPAGTYKVIMTKGKETYTSEVTFVNDPKSALTEEERIANQEATVKLYDMSQELAYMVYQIDEILSKAEEVKVQGGSKNADIVIGDLFELKKTLVTTTGDNYVDTKEAKLRGNIADLYSKIASGFQAPSASEMENMKQQKGN